MAHTDPMVAPMCHGELRARSPSPSPSGSLSERRAAIDNLADDIALCAARLDAAAHRLLSHIRRFDELRGWAVQGAQSCASWLSWRIGIGLAAAREKVRVAHALKNLPVIDKAFERAELSYAKVRAMTRVATPANEDLLLAQARGTTGAQLERICAGFRAFVRGSLVIEENRYVRRRTTADGTVRIEMSMLPDEAEWVMRALSATRDQLRREASCEEAADDSVHQAPGLVDAAVHLAHLGLEHASAAAAPAPAESAPGEAARVGPAPQPDASVDACADEASPTDDTAKEAVEPAIGARPRGGAERSLLFVHLLARDAQTEPTAARGRVPGTETATHEGRSPRVEVASAGSPIRFSGELDDGTRLDPATLLRLACDCGVVLATTDGKGDVLDIGRKRRTVHPALWRAVRMRDRTCRFPGCTHRVYLDAHHIRHWARGGATSLDNLVALCHFHHVAVHEGGFSITTENGEMTFRTSEGRPIPRAPLPARPVTAGGDVMASLAEEQAKQGVEVDARSLLPRFKSYRPPDLRGCVGALVRRHDAELASARTRAPGTFGKEPGAHGPN